MPNYVGKGIPLSAGFDIRAKEPLDHRQVKNTYVELLAIPTTERYVGMVVFVIDDWTQYRLAEDGTTWTVDSNGFLSGETDPDVTIGYKDCLYLNTTSGDVFKKLEDENGTRWEVQFSMIGTGEKGDKGDPGDRGTVWWSGNKISGGTSVLDKIFTDSGITAAIKNDIYYNTDSSDIYQCTLSGGSTQAKWSYIGNIRGLTGESSKIYVGENITGTSTTPTSYQTGITDAKISEIYINSYYGNVYECTVGGDQNTAKWVYVSSLKFNEVAIQDTEPTEPDVKIWIKPNQTQSGNIIPYIKDTTVSEDDTYSSKRIEEIIGGKWYFGNVNGVQIEKPEVSYEVYHIDDVNLANCKVADIYFHRNNFTVYQCIAAGKKDTAEWMIKANLMQPILQVINDRGYMKAQSVTALPATPEPGVIYFIQGEVTVVS